MSLPWMWNCRCALQAARGGGAGGRGEGGRLTRSAPAHRHRATLGRWGGALPAVSISALAGLKPILCASPLVCPLENSGPQFVAVAAGKLPRARATRTRSRPLPTPPLSRGSPPGFPGEIRALYLLGARIHDRVLYRSYTFAIHFGKIHRRSVCNYISCIYIYI